MYILAGVLFGWFYEISNIARRVLGNLQQQHRISASTVGSQKAANGIRNAFKLKTTVGQKTLSLEL